jgi:hypothetical protein
MFTNLAIERGPHIVDMIGIVLGIISRDHIIKKIGIYILVIQFLPIGIMKKISISFIGTPQLIPRYHEKISKDWDDQNLLLEPDLVRWSS